MLAILQLNDDAYGPGISAALEANAKRRVSRGALYSVLDRLKQKGYVRWEIGSANSERGGHPTRQFEVTAAGIDALRASRRALDNLWSDLDHILLGD